MCELLILDKDTWMESLTQQEIDTLKTKDKGFQDNYNARSKKGDVVEIREDGGFPDSHNFPKFRVVKIPGISRSQAEFLMESDTELTPDGKAFIVKKKRIYTINTGDGKKVETVTDLPSLSITDKRI